MNVDLVARMEAIVDLEDQLDEFGAVGEALQGADPRLLPYVLALLERVAGSDDFGTFHTYGNWIEELDADQVVEGKRVDQHLLESIARATNWKVMELADMMVEDKEAVVAALRQRLAAPDIDSASHEAVVHALGEHGVTVPLEPPAAAAPAPVEVPERPRRAWWDVEVRDGIADLSTIDEEQARFLVDHPEHVMDAIYALSFEEIEDPTPLRKLDRLIIINPSFREHNVIAAVEALGPKLYGVRHLADHDGPLSRGRLALLEGLPELRILDLRSQTKGKRYAALLATLPKLVEVTVGERSQFGALEAIPSPALLERVNASEVWGCRKDEPPLTKVEVGHLARFRNLKHVTLSVNHLADDALEPLSRSSELQTLQLTGATWKKPDWSFLEGTPALRELRLWQGGSIPAASAARLAGLQELRVFTTVDATIGSAGVAALARLKQIETLSVAGISDANLAEWSGLTTLRTLTLRSSTITDAGAAALASFSNLRELAISKAPITDAALDHVPPMVTKLSLIKIKGLTPALVHKLARFPRLEEITVAGSPKSVVGPLKAAVEERGIFFSDYGG